jgi:hypothetical protein
MLEDLKAAIPYRFREWDPARKVWTIESAYADLAIEILLRHFPTAETPRHSRPQANTQTRPTDNDPFATLHLLPSAPVEVVKAAYRALAKLHHPDVQGDAITMRRLTEAHDALSRRLSA